jgi:hypothetical protein
MVSERRSGVSFVGLADAGRLPKRANGSVENTNSTGSPKYSARSVPLEVILYVPPDTPS